MPTMLTPRIDRKILDEIVQANYLAQHMTESLWVGDESHNTVYVNPAFEKLSEYSLEEAMNKYCTFFFDAEGKRIIEQHHKLRHKGIASQYEATMVSKTGKKIPLLISGAPTPSGGTIGIFTNLTNLKELSRQEHVAQQILRHSREAIVILDENRKVKLWNSGANKIFGYKEEEVVGKLIEFIIPKDLKEANKELVQEVEKKGHVKNVETKRLSKDGDLVDVIISITKVLDENKHFVGYLIIYRDITQIKRTNTELQKRFEAIQDAYKELGLQKRHLDYIYEIIDAAVSDVSMENLEKLIVSAMSLLTKCDGAVLRIYDKKRKSLKLHSHFGVGPKWWNKDQIHFENSIAKEAFDNHRALIIDDITSYTKHQGVNLLKTHKFKTLIMLPLFIEKEFIGSLSLYSSDPAKFRFIETDFLEKMGKQCSLALFVKKHVK